MTIENKKPLKRPTTFGELKIGEKFILWINSSDSADDDTYEKVERFIQPGSRFKNALRISNNDLCWVASWILVMRTN